MFEPTTTTTTNNNKDSNIDNPPSVQHRYSDAALQCRPAPRPTLISGGVLAATAIATDMTVATAIAIAIALATPKSCAEKAPKNFWSTDLFDQNLPV